VLVVYVWGKIFSGPQSFSLLLLKEIVIAYKNRVKGFVNKKDGDNSFYKIYI
jgi:hypothetical protein